MKEYGHQCVRCGRPQSTGCGPGASGERHPEQVGALGPACCDSVPFLELLTAYVRRGKEEQPRAKGLHQTG